MAKIRPSVLLGFLALVVLLTTVILRLQTERTNHIERGVETALAAANAQREELQRKQREAARARDSTLAAFASAEHFIEIEAHHLGGRRFWVRGSTNLPDGAHLAVSVMDEDYHEYDDRPDQWRYENLTFIPGSVTVKSGHFTTELTGTEVEAPMRSERYLVEVGFNPWNIHQPDKVIEMVGKRGENLRSQAVRLLQTSQGNVRMLFSRVAITRLP